MIPILTFLISMMLLNCGTNYHPADINHNWEISLSEAMGCYANNLTYCDSAVLIWKGSVNGTYYFDKKLECPSCWVISETKSCRAKK